MAEADILQHQLLAAQSADGGWGYQNGTSQGTSWTEPTALALLALNANRVIGGASQRGYEWLVRNQRNDGGWAPQPDVDQSTWVSSLAALALPAPGSTLPHHCRGISWVVSQIQPADAPLNRFIARLKGVTAGFRPAGGSPWFPGTAAWIAPTAMSIVALSNHAVNNNNHALGPHLSEGRQFILSRRCRDGGWNHGGSAHRSENSHSYPEMTGMALLALQGVDPSELLLPLDRATEFVQSPTSLEALSWLQLGLLAHGRDYRRIKTELPCRTIRDISLRLLALAGNCSGNKLLTSS